jgi:NADPH-dependent curcumin reductase CurA
MALQRATPGRHIGDKMIEGGFVMSHSNHQFRLAARPQGLPKASDWDFVTTPAAAPQTDEILVQTKFISLDPAMRGWMNEGKSYVPAVKIGEVMRALAVGEVLESADEHFAPGDFVSGPLGVQEFSTLKAASCQKIDASLAPLPVFLNLLGMTGMTAYFGLLEVGEPKAGETVVVSGAAGAVGAAVGQIAKITGCRVVGIAGGAEKCKYIVDELGFDAAIDYKAEDVAQGLKRACPDGIDVYFDNIGGEILDACLARINLRARIVICGAISQYNSTTAIKGPANYLSLLVNRARMQGMIVFDYADRYHSAAKEMAGWMRDGKLHGREDIVEGIKNFPSALLKLFSGENFGKLVLKV